MPSPVESIHIVARRLDALEIPYAFLGGAVMPFLVDDPALTEFRPTKDVDAIVEAISYPSMSAIEQRLRNLGFQHDTSPDAPSCRWLVEGCKLDLLPTEGRVFGMNSKWFPEALQSAIKVPMESDYSVNVISPAFFLATKLEAFKDRGNRDYFGSSDLEDIITLADGRRGIVGEVAGAPPAVRSFVASSFAALLRISDFLDAFPGHLSSITGARQRRSIVMDRLTSIANMAD
jgi:hypothetical protein